MKNIKLIALDLDETTIDEYEILSDANRKALLDAMDRGIYVVPATGRSYNSLPKSILDLEGIKYVVTSNGGEIREIKTGKLIYSNPIDADTVVEIYKILNKTGLMYEIFAEGMAFIGQKEYDNIMAGRVLYRDAAYVKNTRTPVPDIGFRLLADKNIIENINIFFDTQEEKQKFWEIFNALPRATVTTSMRENIEIGGATTNKANGVLQLAREYGIDADEILACGDSPNDVKLLEMAGIGVAMSNATQEVKAVSDHIVDNSEKAGVAIAIKEFVL